MTAVATTLLTLAQAGRPDSLWVTMVIALVLAGGVAVASMMSSKRSHRD